MFGVTRNAIADARHVFTTPNGRIEGLVFAQEHRASRGLRMMDETSDHDRNDDRRDGEQPFVSVLHGGGLPQASGGFHWPEAAGVCTSGAGCAASHAATSVICSAVSRCAISCMQSGAVAWRVPARQDSSCALI